MTESIAVDGYNLDQLVAQGVQGNSGLFTAAAKRGSNVTVAGRDGTLHVPGKRYGEATVVLPLWARGVNPDGTLPDDPAAQLACIGRVRDIVKRFTVHDLVTIRHTLTDGTAREIVGEVTDAIDATMRGSGRDTLGQATIGLTCADPFWTDIVPTAVTITSGAAVALPGFGSASARMADLLVTFGPSSNPVLTQPAYGMSLAYDGIIDAARTLEVDTAEWVVTGRVDAGGTWNPGTAPTQHIRRIQHSGDARLFVLHPDLPHPVVQLTHTGGGTAQVTVSGRQRHKVA